MAQETPPPKKPSPNQMGEVMATLLLISDAWFELAEDTAPGKYSPADRYQVLGLLVRLVARRFQGVRKIPTRRNVTPIRHDGAVGLHI